LDLDVPLYKYIPREKIEKEIGHSLEKLKKLEKKG